MRQRIIFLCIVLIITRIESPGQLPLSGSIFHPDSLKQHVEALTHDSLQGRYSGSAEAFKAATLIAQEFKNAGIRSVAGNDGYLIPIGKFGYIVMAGLQGKSRPGQVIIFSAHYDHVGTISSNPYPGAGGGAYVESGDTVFNGANDNASGVSAVMALAKYFKHINIQERTILFVAFSGEEQGLAGSQYLVSQLEADSVIAVINIEMIGRKNSHSANPFLTGHDYSDLQKILNKNLYRYNPGKYKRRFFEDDKFTGHFLFMRSDNYPFALKKIPAHTVTITSPLDEYYHNLNDEPETLDFRLMSRIVEAIAIGATGIIKGEDTPSRIKGL